MEYNIYRIEVTDDIKRLECFEFLLKKYKDYKSCLRDIKINTVLGNKCILNIDEIKPEILCNVKVPDVDLYSTALTINKMSFVIDSNLIISSLKINYEVHGDYKGKKIPIIDSLKSGTLKIYPVKRAKAPNQSTSDMVTVVGFMLGNII